MTNLSSSNHLIVFIMKNYHPLLIIFTCFLLVNGCSKGPKPVAAFTMDKTSALAGDLITFTNQSTDAKTYSWNFGDDSISILDNPRHAFRKHGSYTVILTGIGEGGTNAASHVVTILPSLTGKWSSTFTYFEPFNGSLILVQNSIGELSGTMELMTGQGTQPLTSTSKISGTSVNIESIVEGYSYNFKGTVNADYDYITGTFFMDGAAFGNWYAIKK